MKFSGKMMVGAFACGMAALSFGEVVPSIRFAADAGVVRDASGAVTRWANSGSLGDAVALVAQGGGTFAQDAFDGRGAVRFSGSGCLMTSGATDLGFTFNGGAWYCVFRPAATATTSDRVNMGVFGLTPDGMRRTGLFYVFDDNIGKTLQGWALGTSFNAPASDEAMVFRTSLASSSPWKGVLHVGSFCGYDWAKPFKGDLAELRFYPRALTADEDAAIVAELKAKWGEATVLPAEFPQTQTSEAEVQLPHVAWTRVISGIDDRYCGWPTVTAVGPDDLVATFSGDRSGHICPWGRVKMLRSTDGGETWSPSTDVANGILDDRDAGLLKTANGDWLVFWFTSVAFNQDSVVASAPDWRRHFDKLPPKAVRNALGSFVRRSTDQGKTWGRKVRLPASAPHGGIQLKDGRLLVVGTQDHQVRGHLTTDPEEQGRSGDYRRVLVAESTDNGESWHQLAEIPTDKAPGGELCEPHLVEGKDGVLRCYIRNVNLVYSESRDGGKTWSAAKGTSIACWDSPPHLMRLRDGRVLLTCARRVGWSVSAENANGLKTCVYALVGDENGTLESFEKADEIPLYYTPNSDMGYASSAQNADDSLVTVLYSHHCQGPALVVAVKWKLPGLRIGQF